MGVELWAALLVLAALMGYAVSGGADFGGGLWDLLARGPRAAEQRKVISQAMAPIWEANHVWLILLLVLLWICFPTVYASVSTALHIPLLVMLLGIVLRGTAFVFRSYGGGSDREQRSWGLLFSITSIITPIMLGVVLGATATGSIEIDARTGEVQTDFVSDWLALFPFVTGFLVLAIFAFLAAVYLTVEAKDADLQDDFRRRALVTGVVFGALAIVATALARSEAPPLHAGLFRAWWSIPLHGFTALTGIATLVVLWRRRFGVARIVAVGHVCLIMVDWAVSIYPWLMPGQLTIEQAAAPDNVIFKVLIVMLVGTPILGPSLFYLYRVFKKSTLDNGDGH